MSTVARAQAVFDNSTQRQLVYSPRKGFNVRSIRSANFALYVVWILLILSVIGMMTVYLGEGHSATANVVASIIFLIVICILSWIMYGVIQVGKRLEASSKALDERLCRSTPEESEDD